MEWGKPAEAAASTDTATSDPLSKSLYTADQLKEALVGQESGGNYGAIGPTYLKKNGRKAERAFGEIALGKYQVVPKFWFSKIGLNPRSQEDQDLYLSSPELQDEAFNIVLQDAMDRNPDDHDRAIATYYGGSGAASIYGTPEADEPQSGDMPSINRYVKEVKGRIGQAKMPWEMGWSAPAAPEPAAAPPEERPMVDQFIPHFGGGTHVKVPGKTKSEQEAEDLAALDAATQKSDDQARGRDVLAEQADSPVGAFRTPEAISREKMEDVEPPAGIIDRMRAAAKKRTADVGDVISGATQYTTGFLGRGVRGEGLEENLGRRARETEQIITQKQRWESKEGKTFLAQAEAKAEKGQSLSLDEEEALAENPGFLASVEEFGKYAVTQPGKLAKEIGAQILEDGPFMVLSSYGVGSVLRAMRTTGSAFKAGRLAAKAQKMGASPEVVARARRMGETAEAANASARALGKSSLASKVGEEVIEDAAGAALVTLPKETAKGNEYGGKEAAKDVLLGTFMGGPVGAFRHLKDTRVSRATVKGARKVAYLAGAEKHPYIQEMLPLFQALADNPETAGLRFKVSPDKKTISAEQAAAAYGPDYAKEFGGEPEVAGAAGRKKVTQAEAQAGALQKGEVGLYQAGDKETVVEEAAHYLQERLRTKVQEEAVSSGPAKYTALADLVKEWEDRIRAAGAENGVALPKGDELFAQVFTAHMGYADKFPQAVRRVVMPDGIFAGFRKLMGEDPKLQGAAARPDGDLAAASRRPSKYDPAPAAPAQPKKPANPLEGMEEGLAQATQPPDLSKTGGKGLEDMVHPDSRKSWQRMLDDELDAVMRGETRAAARSAAPRPEAKTPEAPGVQILTPTKRAEPAPLPPRRPKEPAFQRRPLPPTEEPGLPARRPPEGADPSSNFPPPYQEPEAVRTSLNQAGRRPLEPLPEETPAPATPPPEPDAPAAPAIPEPGPGAPPAAPAAAAARPTLSGKKLGVSFRKFREAKAYLTKGEVAPKDAEVLEYLRGLGDEPVPAKEKSTRRGTPLDKQMARSAEIRSANQVLRAGDESLETQVVKGKDLPSKFTTAGMEFERVKTRDPGVIRYKDKTGTTYDFRPDEDVHTGGEMGGQPAQPVRAQGPARPTEIDDDEPLPFQLKKGEKKYPIEKREKWYSNSDYESRGGKVVRMSPQEYLDQVRPLDVDEVSRENIEELKQHIESGKRLDPLAIYADGKEDGRHRAYAAKELGISEVPVLDFRTDKISGDDGLGFQLKRGQPKTEQKDIFDNRGRVASQGFIKAKPNDKGAEGTPLFDAPDQEAQAKADEQQTSLFQLKAKEDQKKTLRAIHNTNAEGILAAEDLGGIPGPSTAIVKKDIPFEGFGDISLIAPRGTIDPEGDYRNRIYNSDAYSPRQPRKAYDVDRRGITKVRESLPGKAFEDAGSSRYDIDDWARRTGDRNFDHAMDEAERHAGMMNGFLHENGIVLEKKMRDVEAFSPLLQDKKLTKRLLDEFPDGIDGSYDSHDYAKATTIVREHVEKKYAKVPGIRDDLLRQYIGSDDTRLAFSVFHSLSRDLETVRNPRKELDRHGMTDAIKAEVRKIGEGKYRAWVEEKLKPIFKNPHIVVAGKKRDYTMENIVDAMFGGKVRAAENTMVHGLGQARASAAKEFKSIDAVHKAEDMIQPQKEFEAAKKEIESRFYKLAEALQPHTQSGMFERLDDLSRALGGYLKKSKTPSSMRAALYKNYYRGDIDADDIKDLMVLAEDLANAPTEYFEAKPQRAVPLREFAGAVIPKNTEPDVIESLERQGVKRIEKYDSRKDGARLAAMRKFDDVLFQLKPAPGKRAEEGETPKADDISLGRSTGSPPRVEEKVDKLRQTEIELGHAPKLLKREVRQQWKDLDEESRKLMLEDDAYFYNRLKMRALDPAEAFAWDAKIKGKEEFSQEILVKLTKAREEKSPELNGLVADYTAALLDLEAAVAADLDKSGTRSARALAARGRIMKGARQDSDVAIMRKLAKEFPHLKAGDIGDLVKALRTAPEQFPILLRQASNPGWLDKAIELRSAGLLSGLGTHIRNLGSNTLEQATRSVEAYLAGGVDAAYQKLHGGARTRFKEDAAAELSGMLDTFPQAWKTAQAGFQSIARLEDKPLDHAARYDYQVGVISGKKGAAIRIPFRLLELSDRVFKELGGAAELRKRAGWMAREEGLTGKAREKRIMEIERDIFEKKNLDQYSGMLRDIEKEVKSRVFQDDPGHYTQMVLQAAKRLKPLRIILPFIKTPVNIFKRTVDRSPLSTGAAFRAHNAYIAALKKGDTPPEQISALRATAADQIARTTLGWLLFGGFTGYAMAGGITGGGPSDPDEKNTLRKTGWQPYSFVIHVPGLPRIYVPFAGFEPLSAMLGASADIADGVQGKNTEDKVDKIISSVAENLLNKSYMQSLNEVSTIVTDAIQHRSGSATRYAGKLAASFIPFSSLLGKTASALDPTVRETKSSKKGYAALPEQVAKTVVSRLPGLSMTLPAKLDGTGDEAEKQGGALGRFLGVGNATLEKEGGEVFRELERLNYVPGAPPKEIQVPGMKGRKERLTEEERRMFLEARGRATEKLKVWVERPAWKNADDEKKKKLAEKIYQEANEPVLKRVRLMVRRRVLQDSKK